MVLYELYLGFLPAGSILSAPGRKLAWYVCLPAPETIGSRSHLANPDTLDLMLGAVLAPPLQWCTMNIEKLCGPNYPEYSLVGGDWWNDSRGPGTVAIWLHKGEIPPSSSITSPSYL